MYSLLFAVRWHRPLGGIANQVQRTLHTHGRHDTAATCGTDGPICPTAYDFDPEVLGETCLRDEHPHHAFLASRIIEKLFTGDRNGTVPGARLKMCGIKTLNTVGLQRRILWQWPGDMGRLPQAQIVKLLLSGLTPFALVFSAEARRDGHPLRYKARVWDLCENPVEIRLMVGDHLHLSLRDKPAVKER